MAAYDALMKLPMLLCARGDESVPFFRGDENSPVELDSRRGVTTRLGVAVLDTGELEHALRGRSGDDTGTAGGGDELDEDGTGLALDLARNRVRLSELVAPVTATDGDDRELGEDDGAADRGRDFLGALDTETDVALKVTDGDERLEAGTLTGTGLLLDGVDLHDLVCAIRGKRVNTPRSFVRSPFIYNAPLSLGRRMSMIWYSLIGSEKR